MLPSRTAVHGRRILLRCAVLAVACAAVSCGPVKPPDPPKTTYSNLGPKNVPAFLHNTVFEQTDLQNAGPQRVSGFGLVVNLDGTGDTRAPLHVREFIGKQLQVHGFGSSQAGLQKLGPDEVLNDPKKRVAIVRADGYIPPGAHAGQHIDVQVSALDNSNTTSLNHGELYQTDLSVHGGDTNSPSTNINTDASVRGPVAVNPAYAIADGKPSQNGKLSMRYGLVMNGGTVAEERPLVLKLRQPERRLSRQVENRINERFQDSANERGQGSKIAVAEDEGKVRIYVPKKYGTDWEHFVNVAMHLYSDPNDDFAALKSKQLADIAAKEGPNAPLMDISYCLEGLGEPALPAMRPLYNNPVPDVAYAAARAGAFLGDTGAIQALARIARMAGNAFQINAVETIGALLPQTALTRGTLRELLDGDQLLVRVAAYEALVKNKDGALQSTPVEDKFTLDVVESDGPPVVYATRVGEPRIALIGRPAGVVPPGLLMAMNDALTVLPDAERRSVKIYYRGGDYAREVSLECVQDLKVVVARLGGLSAPGEKRFAFTYTDVVGLLQRMTDTKMIASTYGSDRTPAVFHTQSVPGADDPILSAPEIPDQRPTETPTTQTVLR